MIIQFLVLVYTLYCCSIWYFVRQWEVNSENDEFLELI